ncbi:unnamed protein product, partial [Nesidiocoris tenuis]
IHNTECGARHEEFRPSRTRKFRIASDAPVRDPGRSDDDSERRSRLSDHR